MAWRTRPMNTLLGVALGMALWFATRRLFSEGAANVALALYAFTPSLIAHFSVATTDGIGTLFIFLVAFQLVRWRKNQTAPQAALLGLILGGLLLAKFYAPPIVALALGLMLVMGPSELRSRPMELEASTHGSRHRPVYPLGRILFPRLSSQGGRWTSSRYVSESSCQNPGHQVEAATCARDSCGRVR